MRSTERTSALGDDLEHVEPFRVDAPLGQGEQLGLELEDLLARLRVCKL